MRLLATVSCSVVFFIVSSTDVGESHSNEVEYTSVCDGCKTITPIAVMLSSAMFDYLKPVLFAYCNQSPDANSTVDLSAVADVSSPTFASECRALIDDGLTGAAHFVEDLAGSPESADEFCHVLRCESETLEEINRRIFKAKSEGNLELACNECQLAMPEALKVFDEPEVKENFRSFTEAKFCPRISDAERCKKIVDFVSPIIVDSFRKSSTDYQKMCKMVGACDGEITDEDEDTPKGRSFEEL